MTIPVVPELEEPSAAPVGERRRWLAPPPIRGMRAAFAFLTRVPVGGFPYRREDWKWASAHSPLVGLWVGAIIAGCHRLLLPIGTLAGAILAIGVSLLVTGAFHEDGLADTSDALGGGYDSTRVLAILKDSRIGTFGGAALVVSIAGRAALLAELGTADLWAMPLVGCVARTAPIWLMAALPYVTLAEGAKSRDIARGGLVQAIVATLWLAATLILATLEDWITFRRAAAVVLTAIGVACLSGWRYRRRLGGVTGDFLGATEQLGELFVLCTLVWRS